jgi:hypothetical protein
VIRPHLLGVLATLGLTAAVVAPTPAQAQEPAAAAGQTQTIQFTSTPPSGFDWYTRQTSLGFEYVAQATATSGLPVEYSIAPASVGVCEIATEYQDHPFVGPGAPIHLLHAGTCTVLADQPGDDEYLPAPQVAQSFQVEKVQTWLSKVKARKGLPGFTPATFSAKLETWERISSFWFTVGPFRGQEVAFSVAGRQVCSAITDANGVATCRATLLRSELTRLRFTATYAGTDDYTAVAGSAFFLG